MSSSKIYIFTFLVITIPYIVSSHNITEILGSDPDSDFSEFNHYLTLTKLANEINSRLTITVLAVSNSALSSLISGNISNSAIKNILSLHVLLDYYDYEKLHDMTDHVATSTTLYQTTGLAEDKTGQVNITEFKNGTIGFGSAQPGLKPGPKFVKEIRSIPFNISVMKISAPIIVPSLLTSGPLDPDVSAILEKEGCKKFLSLLTSSGVLKVYKDQLKNGITIFAPTDVAFKAKGMPDISNLTESDMVSLLDYHALASYAPIDTLKSSKGSRLATLAPPGKYGLTATVTGGNNTVILHTGVVNARVIATMIDSAPVVIFRVDTVLLPVALFGNSSAPAEAPAPEIEAPTPAPAPAPEPAAKSPGPARGPVASPPDPPADEGGDDGGDAESPDNNSDDDGNTKKSGAKGNGSLCMGVLMSSLVCWVISHLLPLLCNDAV